MVRSGPNKSELARLLLDWEVLERRRIELEGAIKDAVLQIGETVEVGYVVASYSGGRKKYDYKAAAEQAELPNEVWNTLHAAFTQTSIDWRGFCMDARTNIEDIPFTKSDPSVSLKLLK